MGPFLHNRPHARTSRGFTLIEMIVVLAIITIIALVVITSQSSFNRTLILANAAYDVALTIRSAQSYGVGSRAQAGIVRAGYGASFTANRTVFTFFADSSPPLPGATACHPNTGGTSAPDAKAGDCAYGAGDVRITEYTLSKGIAITDICTYTSSARSCVGDGTSQLDIVFARPSPAPFLGRNGTYSASITKACIALASPQGGSRAVVVTSSGEINADASSCPSS